MGEVHTGIGGEMWKEERNHLKNPDVDGRIMRYSPDCII